VIGFGGWKVVLCCFSTCGPRVQACRCFWHVCTYCACFESSAVVVFVSCSVCVKCARDELPCGVANVWEMDVGYVIFCCLEYASHSHNPITAAGCMKVVISFMHKRLWWCQLNVL